MGIKTKKLFAIPVMLLALKGVSYGYIDAGIEFSDSSEKSIDSNYTVEESLLLPLAKVGNGLLLANVKQGFSEDESKFANVGIAIRGGIGSNNVLGFYTFYDYLNSSYGNKFHQVSAGIESISDFIEARVNGYLPIKDRHFEELKLQNQDEKPVIKFNDRNNVYIDGEFLGTVNKDLQSNRNNAILP